MCKKCEEAIKRNLDGLEKDGAFEGMSEEEKENLWRTSEKNMRDNIKENKYCPKEKW